MKYWYNCDKCEHRNILDVPIFHRQHYNIVEYMCEECGHHIGFMGNGSIQFYNKKADGLRYGHIPDYRRYEYIPSDLNLVMPYETTVGNYVTITTSDSTTTSPINYRIVENDDGSSSIIFE